MKNVASLPSPLGKLLSEITRPNGMVIRKMTVPFGVIGVIYEARPNVTFDVFLPLFQERECLRVERRFGCRQFQPCLSGDYPRRTDKTRRRSGCLYTPAARPRGDDRAVERRRLVDLIIPRGSSSLINYVRDHARVPVIETGAGICHTYFDKDGDKEKGREIVNNAKTRRVSVCNALDCLIVHRDRLGDLPYLCGKLSGSNVIIYADEPAFAALSGHYPTAWLQPAMADSFGTEFLDYKMRSVQSPPWMKPCNISPATARNTAKASSVNRQKPSAVSSKWSMPPASTPMYLRLSPTGHSSVSERKSVSAHRSYMPAPDGVA